MGTWYVTGSADDVYDLIVKEDVRFE